MSDNFLNRGINAVDLTQKSVQAIEQAHPNLDRAEMVRVINTQKRQLAAQIYSQLPDDRARKEFTVDKIVAHLESMARNMEASVQTKSRLLGPAAQQEAVKEGKDGWIMWGLKTAAAPFKYAFNYVKDNPIKSTLAAVVLATIAAGYNFGWIERWLQDVGTRRIVGGGNAIEPVGQIAHGEYFHIPADELANIQAIEADPEITQLPGPAQPTVSPGDSPTAPADGGGFWSSMWNLWGSRSGPIVPGMNTPGVVPGSSNINMSPGITPP